MGPPKLADTLSIPIEEAEELFREYGKAFPKLNKWLDEQAAFAKKNAYSVTFAPCKRRRWYPDMKEARELRALGRDKLSKDDWRRILQIEGQTERNGMNMPIQG